MKQEGMSVEAFLQMQASDPELVARFAEGQRQFDEMVAKRLNELRPFLDEIAEVGYVVQTPTELRGCGRLSPEAVQILFKWLAKDGLDRNTYDSLLSATHFPKRRFDGTPFTNLWNKLDASWRWDIAYAIAESQPTGIGDWIISQLQDPSVESAREWLCLAAAKLCPPPQARAAIVDILQQANLAPGRGVYDDLPLMACQALALCGDGAELEFLRSKLDSSTGKVKKAIEKAIKKLEKSLHVNGYLIKQAGE